MLKRPEPGTWESLRHLHDPEFLDQEGAHFRESRHHELLSSEHPVQEKPKKAIKK